MHPPFTSPKISDSQDACWFDNWESDLVNLGFATRGIDSTITILDDQLLFIILNFDERCLSLDGSERSRGEWQVIMQHDPWFPYSGKQTNTDSLAATLICGSNAASEALPPHFQFQTKTTTDDGKPLQNGSSIVNKWLGDLERTTKGRGVFPTVLTQRGRCTSQVWAVFAQLNPPPLSTHMRQAREEAFSQVQ